MGRVSPSAPARPSAAAAPPPAAPSAACCAHTAAVLPAMEDSGTLRCNGCWSACDSSQPIVATACQHLYCLSCCQTILESDDPTCPICSQASGANRSFPASGPLPPCAACCRQAMQLDQPPPPD